MKTSGTFFQIWLIGAMLLALPAAAQVPFTWTTNSGTITITGYTGTNGLVTIPDNLTGLPVTSIGTQAFFGNRVMTNVMTGTNLTSIGEEAFQSCANLTNIVIGTNVTSLGVEAFYNCGKLMDVALPAGFTSLGQYALADCTSLTAISVAPSNPDFSSAGGVLFNKNQTTLVVYPGGLAGAYTISNTVTSIGVASFWDSIHLTGITFPPNVTTIEVQAFAYCAGLTSVVIGSGVTTIQPDAFDDCAHLASITIPSSTTTSIGQPLCYGCASLTSIVVNAANPDYVTVGGVLFNQGQTMLLQYPGGLAGAYTVANSVTSIASEAFGGSPALTAVCLPFTVTNIGSYAFESCGSLAGVYFQGNAPVAGSDLFDEADAAGKAYYFAGTTGWSAMYSDWPAVMLNPPQMLGIGVGIKNDAFGFTVVGTNTQNFVVEACTNLLNPAWQLIQINTISAAAYNVTDSQWTNFPARYYRIVSTP